MMAQMLAGAGGPGGPSAGAGAGGPANPFMGGKPPASPFAPAPKTLLERFFPLVHIMSMVALAVYVVCVYEPAKRVATYGWAGANEGVDWSAWSALLTHRPSDLAVGSANFRGLASVVSLGRVARGGAMVLTPAPTIRDAAFAVDVRQHRAGPPDDATLPAAGTFTRRRSPMVSHHLLI